MQTTKPVKDPGKQRNRLFNAPAHVRHKLMSAHLAPELIKSHGIKALPVRKGDTVRIMRGDHEGFEGKISTVDLKHYRIFLEGLTREKVDGTIIFVSVHPSKVLIKNLNLSDKWRKRIVERKKQLPKKEEIAAEKPVKEVVKPSKAKVKSVKAKAPVEVKEEKPVEKKPRVVKKTVKKAEVTAVKEKPAAVTKPAPKAPSKKKKAPKEQAPTAEKTEAKKPAKKPSRAPVKKATAKKVTAKGKPKTKKETGGA
jgi:large subunit ribosomal protein L24